MAYNCPTWCLRVDHYSNPNKVGSQVIRHLARAISLPCPFTASGAAFLVQILYKIHLSGVARL